MKITTLFFLGALFFAGCKKKTNIEDDCTPANVTYDLQSNKGIDLVPTTDSINYGDFSSYTLNNSSHLVFQYRHNLESCITKIDSGGSEYFMFEAPADADNFTLDDSISFKKSKAVYAFYGWAFAHGLNTIKKGNVVGKKINATTWSITGSIKDPKNINREVVVNGSYTQK